MLPIASFSFRNIAFDISILECFFKSVGVGGRCRGM